MTTGRTHHLCLRVRFVYTDRIHGRDIPRTVPLWSGNLPAAHAVSEADDASIV